MNIPHNVPVYVYIQHYESDLHTATLTIAQTNGQHLTLERILLTTQHLINLAALLTTCPRVTCGLTPDPPPEWPHPSPDPNNGKETTGKK